MFALLTGKICVNVCKTFRKYHVMRLYIHLSRFNAFVNTTTSTLFDDLDYIIYVLVRSSLTKIFNREGVKNSIKKN